MHSCMFYCWHNYNKINVTDLQKPTIYTQETHRIIIHISLRLNYNLRYLNKVVYTYARNTLNSQNHCRNKICHYVSCSHRGTKSEILIISCVLLAIDSRFSKIQPQIICKSGIAIAYPQYICSSL